MNGVPESGAGRVFGITLTFQHHLQDVPNSTGSLSVSLSTHQRGTLTVPSQDTQPLQATGQRAPFPPFPSALRSICSTDSHQSHDATEAK
ncbi:hypothetical protein AAFF_G00248490 [Aldrovandia affinis]|uniref:Uncharacterized protein n=1 Tax=Aldrovandia affinis TaxID=143900 RepID=A0AAD7RD45_9TELE|nr:hypothetical protein AAFF_G00248490 [Aldrovandia affinis]